MGAGPRLVWECQVRQAAAELAAGHPEAAAVRLRPLIRERPEQARPRLLWAEAARRLGRLDEAAGALQGAVAAGLPVDEGRRTYALIFARLDFPQAEGALERVLRDDPGDREARRALAEGYLGAQRWKRAADAATAWLADEPGSTAARLIRARASWESAHWPEAEADFRAVLAAEPDHFAARIQLADCLLNDAKLDLAEPELRRCQQLDPSRPEPLVGLAAIATEQGHTDRAATLLDEALARNGDFLPALGDRARLHIAEGNDTAARPLLERAVRLAPADESLRFLLAQLDRRARPAGK